MGPPAVRSLKERKAPPREGSGLAIRSFNDELDLPAQPAPSMSQSRFSVNPNRGGSREVASFTASRLRAPAPAESSNVPLDGFRLLAACGVEFPDQAHRGDASSIGASSVVAEDLAYFPSLGSLDLGRNQIPSLAPLAALPALRELRIPCNGIRDPLEGHLDGSFAGFGPSFACLATLDLSYNLVADPRAVAALAAALPALRDLDLTCNGLSSLPPPAAMAGFQSLTRLVLERNGLRDYPEPGGGEASGAEASGAGFLGGGSLLLGSPGGLGGGSLAAGQQPPPSTLESLAAVPHLEELQLGHNYLTAVPHLAPLPGGGGGGGGAPPPQPAAPPWGGW